MHNFAFEGFISIWLDMILPNLKIFKIIKIIIFLSIKENKTLILKYLEI